jgi:hypothetical protein
MWAKLKEWWFEWRKFGAEYERQQDEERKLYDDMNYRW